MQLVTGWCGWLEAAPYFPLPVATVFGMLRVTRGGNLRSRSQVLLLLLPAAVGIAFGFAEVYALGFMAARPYPHWYVLLLQGHKHLKLELWGVVAMAAPVAFLAAACGAVLARIAKNYSMSVPLVAVGAWLVCRLILIPVLWNAEPISTLRDEIRYLPISMLAGMGLPALALFLVYRKLTRRPLSAV
jgi:hypothetical protein